MGHNTNDKNHAENSSFEIQKIIEQEIDALRELLGLFSIEENSFFEQDGESKKQILRQRSEIFKKLRSLKKEKDSFFETFFYETVNNCDLSIQKDHLSSIQSEVDKKQTQSKRNLKPSPQLKPKFNSQVLPKTIVQTLDHQEESPI